MMLTSTTSPKNDTLRTVMPSVPISAGVSTPQWRRGTRVSLGVNKQELAGHSYTNLNATRVYLPSYSGGTGLNEVSEAVQNPDSS